MDLIARNLNNVLLEKCRGYVYILLFVQSFVNTMCSIRLTFGICSVAGKYIMRINGIYLIHVTTFRRYLRSADFSQRVASMAVGSSDRESSAYTSFLATITGADDVEVLASWTCQCQRLMFAHRKFTSWKYTLYTVYVSRSVAQRAERRTRDRKVPGSKLACAICHLAFPLGKEIIRHC